MTRGRKPTPSYLGVLNGTRSHKAQNKDEPQPSEDLGAPPHWMNEKQKDIWRYAISTAPAGLLKNIDASLFTAWVIASDVHAEAAQKVNTIGQMVKSPVNQTPMQNPYLSIMNKQAVIMVKCAIEMGFTPSSRSRVKVDRRKNKQAASDPFGDLKSLSED